MRAHARAIGAALFVVTAACSSGGDEASDVSSDAGAADAMVSSSTSAPTAEAGPEPDMATGTSESPAGTSDPPAPTTTGRAGSAAAQRAPSPTTTAAPAPTTAPPTTTTTAPPAGPTAAITIQNFAFSPPVLNVAAGTTVTATNRDSAPHSWTADDGTWDSGTLGQNASYSYRFGRSGTFSYYCAIHPSMKGTVNVA